MSFLEQAVHAAYRRIEDGYYDQSRPETIPETIPEKKSLKMQLQRGFTLIPEIKLTSPTQGILYAGNVEELAHAYASAGASAISVLTVPEVFGGSLQNIAAAKKTGLVILAKDFVVSLRQLRAFSRFGADAVLLINRVFDRVQAEFSLEQAIEHAHQFGLEVLLEVHTKAELKIALQSEADVVGINNRDLDTLELNASHYKDVFEGIDRTELKKPVIAESGFETRLQVDQARAAGLSGVLVGTGILKTGNPGKAVKALL